MAQFGTEDGGGHTNPSDCQKLRQFTVLMERGNFQLAELLHRFEQRGVAVLGLSMFETPECILVRLVLTQPDIGREVLERSGLAIIETQLLAVELSEPKQTLLGLCRALLQANVKVIHICPLPPGTRGRTIVGVMVEDLEAASTALRNRGFRVLTGEEF